jgi:hypothetical protein
MANFFSGILFSEGKEKEMDVIRVLVTRTYFLPFHCSLKQTIGFKNINFHDEDES